MITSDHTKTLLSIGPVHFKHEVQSINIEEQRSVQALNTTRSSKNYIIDNGVSVQKATIRFLFTGVDEINAGLRKLVALFKCCPITTISNEMIISAWGNTFEKNNEKEKDSESNEDMTEGYQEPSNNEFSASYPVKKEKGKKYIKRSMNVPVALEEIAVSSVPDIPYSFYVTLTIARISVKSVSPNGDLLYLTEEGAGSESPQDAFWLKKWIDRISDSGNPQFTKLNETDFNYIRYSWFGVDAIGAEIKSPIKPDSSITIQQTSGRSSPDFISNTKTEQNIKVQSESAVIRNNFSYHTLIGKGIPFAQHMGSTARSYSTDIVVIDENKEFEKIAIFIEAADEAARAKERESRVIGWKIESPVLKILNIVSFDTIVKNNIPNMQDSGVYTPISISSETTSEPFVKKLTMDLVENNPLYFKESLVILNEGGYDITSLRLFFDRLVSLDYRFRSIGNTNERIREVNSRGELFKAHESFWPYEMTSTSFSLGGQFGVLNRDAMMAIFMNSSYDIGQRLRIALAADPSIQGMYRVGASRPNFAYRTLEGISQVREIIFGVSPEDEKHRLVYEATKSLAEKIFNRGVESPENKIQTDSAIQEITNYMFESFYYEPSEAGAVIQKLAGSNLQLSQPFLDALFEVITERKPFPYEFTKPLYNVEGVHYAFYKLVMLYSLYLEQNNDDSDDITRNNKQSEDLRRSKRSLFPDLILPTYVELFGDKWNDRRFSPTYSDLGIVNYNSDDPETRQEEIAVSGNDFVSPHVWFYKPRYKPEILDKAVRAAASGNQFMEDELTLSVPFDIDEMKEIERLARDIAERSDYAASDTIAKIVINSITNSNDLAAKAEDLRNINLLADAIERSTSAGEPGNIPINFKVTNKGNVSVKRVLTAKGVSASILRIASEQKLLTPRGRLSVFKSVDEEFKSAGQNEFTFLKNLSDNTEKTVKSSLDQIPDDYHNPSRMYPACKVYLLERRGDEIIGDDGFFSVNPIVSIDITLDKDDADLAVITVADPLYNIQRDYFDNSNVQSLSDELGNNIFDKNGKGRKIVLPSLKGDRLEGYLKRFKVAQGRAIQIKMGYDSNPENLKTIFTGRISEINPGDQLVIVAQGWKAELINRQVSFVNTNIINWGAKDLAVQAIIEAGPDGMGKFYPAVETSFILENIDSPGISEVLQKVLTTRRGTDVDSEVDGAGTRSLGEDITNALLEYVGLRGIEKYNTGLDTRLKNIWYPDIADTNNFLGWRYWWPTANSNVNDGWVVPIQPAWEVLKEAARHTWGNIVQVVPFDGEATIFFGQPDQPYYFTKGSKRTRRQYKKYLERLKSSNDKVFELLKDFKSSNYYLGPEEDGSGSSLASKNLVEEFFKRAGYQERPGTDAEKSFLDYIYGSTKFDPGNPKFNLFEKSESYGVIVGAITRIRATSRGDDYRIFTDYLDSLSTPRTSYGELEKILNSSRAPYIIMSMYLNVDEPTLSSLWLTLPRNIRIILSESPPEGSIQNPLSSMEVVKSDEELRKDQEDDAFLRRISSFMGGRGGGIATPLSDSIVNSGRGVKTTKTLNYEFPDFSDKLERLKFKAFVYALHKYISNNPDLASKLYQEASSMAKELPPNMQVFRVQHYVDSNHDIIKNDIVATTRDMWNTVVIEHPAVGALRSIITNKEDLYSNTELYSGIKWVYAPKSQITGVIGLQFNPNLTLSNKKIKVFQELNVQGGELAARVACNHLAEGIRKMYRGSLIIKGRHIKPYDRVTIFDDYTDMQGVIEVESVVHHWNNSDGWVCNIIPQTMVESNPGAAIVNSMALDFAYSKVFKLMDTTAEYLTYAMILGGITRLTTVPAKAALENFVGGPIKRRVAAGIANLKNSASIILDSSNILNPKKFLKTLVDKYGGLTAGYATLTSIQELGSVGLYGFYRYNVTSAFIRDSQKNQSLPVIVSPLIYNGIPLTAGLESDDPIWSVPLFDTFTNLSTVYSAAKEVVSDYLGTMSTFNK